MKGIAAAMAALMVSVTTVSAQDGTLRIANYGGLFTEITNKCFANLFEHRTGIKVEWVDGNPTDHVARLIATTGSEPPFDLMYLDDSTRAQGLAAGVFETFDTAKLTNFDKIYNVAKVSGNYGVAVNFTSIGLAYNAEIFKKKGIPEPTKWADLWNPQLAGHVAIPDITTSAGMAIVTVAARLTGGDEHNVRRAFEKLAEIKPLYYFKSSADLQSKFASADAWIAVWYNGRAWAMINSGFPMKYILPEDKGFAVTTTVHIAKGTKNKEAAMQYLDLALEPEPQLCQAVYQPYGPTNVTLAAVMEAYPDLAKQFPASEKDMNDLYLLDWDAINKSYPEWIERWNRMVVK